MNAFRHGLSGNHLLLQRHEREAHTRLTSALTREYAPATESERQFVQKIIDCHTRLNRIAAIENNILNVGATRYTNPDSGNDEMTESLIAQAAAWTAEANTTQPLRIPHLPPTYPVHKGTRPHPNRPQTRASRARKPAPSN